MYLIKAPVPRLEIMPIYYSKVSTSHRIIDSKSVILRYNDTVYNPQKPTKENIIDNYENPFGNSPYLYFLKNICSWQVVEDGVFYIRYKEGLRYLHKSGELYKIDDDSSISDISFENGIIKTYAVKNLRQTHWNEHYDTYGGYDEEWRDHYEVEKQEVSKFVYKEILKKIYSHEERLFAEQNNLTLGISESYRMFIERVDRMLTRDLEARKQMLHVHPQHELQTCTKVLNISPLFYKNKMMGYRFSTDNGDYDMSQMSADKYGLDKSKINMDNRIDLIREYNFLFDPHEVADWKNNSRFVYDISADEECCKKMIQLLLN